MSRPTMLCKKGLNAFHKKKNQWSQTAPLNFLHGNPLPQMPSLSSSHPEANKDVMSKIFTNGNTIFGLSRKHCGKRRNCSLRALSSFPSMFSKAVFC